jgi:hypothetical protein
MTSIKTNVFVLFFVGVLLLSGFVFSQAAVPIKIEDYKGNGLNAGSDLGDLSTSVSNVSNLNILDIESIEQTLPSIMNNTEFIRCISSDLKSQIITLYARYKAAKEKGDEATITEIKKEATELAEKVRLELKECFASGQVIQSTKLKAGAPSNLICDVPVELRNELNLAWKDYEEIVSSMKTTVTSVDPRLAEVKERINQIQEKIRIIKQNCVNTTQATVAGKMQPGQGVGTWAMENTTCVVPVELTQTYEGLMIQYNQAVAANDKQKAEELIGKINEIKEKIAATKGQCVKAIVTTKAAEIRDVIENYKEKLEELKNITDVEERNQLRQEIHNETKEMIKAIAQEKKTINATAVSELVNTIQIGKDNVKLDEDEINATDFAVVAKIKNRTMNITKLRDQILMRVENETGLSIPLPGVVKIMNGTMIVDNLPVKITPDEIREKARMKIKEMTMEKENNTLIYSVSGEEDRKFLGIFAIKVEKKIKANAETGQIVKEELPWWSFLTTKAE